MAGVGLLHQAIQKQIIQPLQGVDNGIADVVDVGKPGDVADAVGAGGPASVRQAVVPQWHAVKLHYRPVLFAFRQGVGAEHGFVPVGVGGQEGVVEAAGDVGDGKGVAIHGNDALLAVAKGA